MRKKLKLVKNIICSNFRYRLPQPYKLTFIVTYKCNLKCAICNVWKNPSVSAEMGPDAIGKTFRSINNLGWLDLSGGEITLKEGILEIIRTITINSRKLCVLHFATNGQLPQEAVLIAQEIGRRRVVPVVNVSIDGPQGLHDELRGVNGAYKMAVETFTALKKLRKGHCYISCTLSRYNIGRIDEFLSGLKRDIPGFNIRDLHFNIFHNSRVYYHNQGIDGLAGVGVESLMRYLRLAKSGGLIKYFLEDKYIKWLPHYLRGNKVPMRCQAMRSGCFINPEGRVYPCSIYDAPAGDLKDYDYDLNALWKSRQSLEVCGRIEEGRCPGCWSPCEAYPAILGNILGRIKKTEG